MRMGREIEITETEMRLFSSSSLLFFLLLSLSFRIFLTFSSERHRQLLRQCRRGLASPAADPEPPQAPDGLHHARRRRGQVSPRPDLRQSLDVQKHWYSPPPLSPLISLSPSPSSFSSILILFGFKQCLRLLLYSFPRRSAMAGGNLSRPHPGRANGRPRQPPGLSPSSSCSSSSPLLTLLLLRPSPLPPPPHLPPKVPRLGPNETVPLTLQFTAPGQSGQYFGSWSLQSHDGAFLSILLFLCLLSTLIGNDETLQPTLRALSLDGHPKANLIPPSHSPPPLHPSLP